MFYSLGSLFRIKCYGLTLKNCFLGMWVYLYINESGIYLWILINDKYLSNYIQKPSLCACTICIDLKIFI